VSRSIFPGPTAAKPSQPPERIVVVCGPTASGKTDLALELALRLDGEIVGADSRQVYRHMDVGTAKPSAAARSAVRHHLVDIVEPDEPFDVADWRALALDALVAIGARRRVAIVCGGTGLYLRSLLHGLFAGPPADEGRRRSLEAEEERAPGTLHARLAVVDPVSAARIHRNDRLRVVRALEVYDLSGEPLSAWHERHRLAERPFDALVLEVVRGADDLRMRIDARAVTMVEAGILAEVRGLGASYDLEAKAFSAIGYREARDCLRGRLPEGDLAGAIARATRAYAKRQRVWLRGQMSTVPVDADDLEGAFARARDFLATRESIG
jgi:tRNA dimethylallyltransferase